MRECKSRASLFVVIALVAGAASAAAEAPRLDLVWVDPTDLAGGTFPALAAESRALLATTGAQVTWTAAPYGAVVGPESLVVIAVPTYATEANRDRHVMGSTRATADGPLAIWIFPDQVAWALGLDLSLRRGWGERAEMEFARAAGQEEQDLERLGREMDGEAFAPDLSCARVHFVDPEAKSRRALRTGRQGRPGGPIAGRGRWPSIKSSNSTALGRRAMRGGALRIRRATAECASVEGAAGCERS